MSSFWRSTRTELAPLAADRKGASIAACTGTLNACSRLVWSLKNQLVSRGFTTIPRVLHTCGEAWAKQCIHWGKQAERRRFLVAAKPTAAVEKPVIGLLSILAPGPHSRASISLSSPREAHLSAQSSQAQAPARLPGAHVDAGRPGNPQAPPSSRAEAPLGVSSSSSRRRRATPEPTVPLA